MKKTTEHAEAQKQRDGFVSVLSVSLCAPCRIELLSKVVDDCRSSSGEFHSIFEDGSGDDVRQ